MIEISFFTTEIAVATIWLIIRVIVCMKNGVDFKREALHLLMYINIAVLVRFTFFPMEEAAGGGVQPLVLDPGNIVPFNINLVPFAHMLENETTGKILLNIIGNITMFIPTGIILPILYLRLDRFWKVVVVGALMSLCIELIQLPFSARTTDVDDLILNTLGVAIGYAIFAGVHALILRRRSAGKREEGASADPD